MNVNRLHPIIINFVRPNTLTIHAIPEIEKSNGPEFYRPHTGKPKYSTGNGISNLNRADANSGVFFRLG